MQRETGKKSREEKQSNEAKKARKQERKKEKEREGQSAYVPLVARFREWITRGK